MAAGVCGVVLGAIGGVGGSAGEEQAAKEPTNDASLISEADVDEAVAEATEQLEQDLGEKEDEIAATNEEITAAKDDLKVVRGKLVAVKKSSAAAKRKAAKALATERAKVAEAQESTPVQTFADTPAAPTTDPQFGTCGEANDNGYGPYQSGVDTEYGWYDDRDGDGIVCES
ncbi:hypothetical protein ASD30_10290 [Nocardioides sp. Root140]|nr:hypothetical protein ASD30_10290 [Nocardioides sp. Root140]